MLGLRREGTVLPWVFWAVWCLVRHPLHEPQPLASAGFAFMLNAKSSSCLIFFGFFRFFAVLFGLAVFKFFPLVAVVRRQEETSLWIQFYPQKFGFVAYVVFFFFVVVAFAAAVIQFICLSAECVLGSVWESVSVCSACVGVCRVISGGINLLSTSHSWCSSLEFWVLPV